jgi:putative membrane protein
MRMAVAALSVLLSASEASAHDGKPHNAHDLIYTWGLDPLVLASLALAAWFYYRGIKHLWREARPNHGIRKWEVAAFAAGWFALFVALVSPLHPLGEVLFSAHMTQHEMLMLIGAPLVVLGKPHIAFAWALRVGMVRRIGDFFKRSGLQKLWHWSTRPLVAWLIHAVALWVWHIPVLFDATLSSNLVHTAQHISFFGSALLFWWSLIYEPRGAMSYGAAALYVFTTSVHSGVLGALITFANTVLYPAYSHTTASWGITALEDQHLGGLIMWVPAGVAYIVAGLALCAGWLRESEKRVLTKERQLHAAQARFPATR